MIDENIRRCPICENLEIEVLGNIKMDLPTIFNLPSSYNVVSCVKCGFCYADTEATRENYDHYYQFCNNYSKAVPTFSKEESAFHKIYDSIKLLLASESRILDMGFGGGEFLLELKKHGYTNLVGIDPSQESVDSLIRHGIEAFCGGVYDEVDAKLEEEFEGVFLIGVLEHLIDPKLAITQLVKYLKPSGKIFVIVPNINNIDKANTPQPNNFNQEHINYFSPKSLENIMEYIGLKKVIQYNCLYKGESFDEEAVVAIYGKTSCSIDIDLEKDKITYKAIKKYLKKEKEKELKRIELIDQLKENKTPLIIWGTGAFTNTLFAATALKECNITAFVDNHPEKIGTMFKEEQIISPDDLENREGKILICSMLAAPSIEKQIKQMKLTNEYIIID